MGVAAMPVGSRRRTNVIVELLAGYVIIRDSGGKRLGSWRASEVRAKRSDGARLLLTVGREEISFETKDPAVFLKSLEAESRYFQEMAPTDRMKQAARMGAVHFGKEPDEPDSPAEPAAESQLPDSLSFDPDPPAKQGSTATADPEELVEHDSPHALLEAIQPSVVDSIQFGMKSWFGFFLLTGEGTGQERLNAAILGLREASNRLRDVSNVLEKADDLDLTEAEFVDTYRRAVDGWAEAMTSIARGIELDQQHVADDGFALLADAADIAKRVVRSPVYPNLLHTHAGPSLVGESLASLAGLSPPAKVSKVAVRRAKQPWEKAIISAASPFRHP